MITNAAHAKNSAMDLPMKCLLRLSKNERPANTSRLTLRASLYALQ